MTVWQVFTDLASAGAVPDGFGHLYTKQANADGWIAVTRPDPWTDAETERLNDFLTRMDTSD